MKKKIKRKEKEDKGSRLALILKKSRKVRVNID